MIILYALIWYLVFAPWSIIFFHNYDNLDGKKVNHFLSEAIVAIAAISFLGLWSPLIFCPAILHNDKSTILLGFTNLTILFTGVEYRERKNRK